MSGYLHTASNNGNGIIFAGFYNNSTYVANTNKYLFAGDIVTAGTYLGAARYAGVSLSSVPGGF